MHLENMPIIHLHKYGINTCLSVTDCFLAPMLLLKQVFIVLAKSHVFHLAHFKPELDLARIAAEVQNKTPK